MEFEIDLESPAPGINPSEADKIIFFHIPKCGGTNLKYIFDEIANSRGEMLAHIFNGDTNAPFNNFTRDQFSRESKDLLDKVTVLYGHDTAAIHREIKAPCTYVTMLRDPVMRLISYYYAGTRLAVQGNPGFAEYQSRTLEEWVDAVVQGSLKGFRIVDWLFDNWGDEPEGLSSRDRAIKNLEERFSFVGITEHFEESLFLMCRIFGWSPIPMWQKAGATSHRPNKTEIPSRIIRKIENFVVDDIEIYDHHRSRLLEMFNGCDFGENFIEYKRISTQRLQAQ